MPTDYSAYSGYFETAASVQVDGRAFHPFTHRTFLICLSDLAFS